MGKHVRNRRHLNNGSGPVPVKVEQQHIDAAKAALSVDAHSGAIVSVAEALAKIARESYVRGRSDERADVVADHRVRESDFEERAAQAQSTEAAALLRDEAVRHAKLATLAAQGAHVGAREGAAIRSGERTFGACTRCGRRFPEPRDFPPNSQCYCGGFAARFAYHEHGFTRRTQLFVPTDLTERQREIARLMLSGKSAAAIAEQLVITINTVRTHQKRIYQRLRVRGASEMERALKS